MRTSLRKGDPVVVIAGGNKHKRPNKGKTGKIQRFVGSDRVIVESINLVTRHQRAAGPNKPAGQVRKEAPIHVSNVMYYVEKIKAPVRLHHKMLEDGRKVRGYQDPQTQEFVQVDS